MLTPIAENLWAVHVPAHSRGPRISMRMTVVRLKDESVWLHSPVPLDDGALAAIQLLGPVRTIVAPSIVHHQYVAACRRLFPHARVLAAPGLAEKHAAAMGEHFPGMPVFAEPGELGGALYHGALGDSADASYSADLDQFVVRGIPKLNEVVFLHKSSRTLILTDLLFNFHRPLPLKMRLFLTMTGKIGEPCQTAVLKWFVKDKAAFAASIERIMEWEFDRIIVSHGDIVASDGKAALHKATVWLRN